MQLYLWFLIYTAYDYQLRINGLINVNNIGQKPNLPTPSPVIPWNHCLNLFMDIHNVATRIPYVSVCVRV